jgi:hypothetical protein
MRVWCCLKNENGDAYQGTNQFSVILSETAIIDDLRDAVKIKNSIVLQNIEASQLKVYPNNDVPKTEANVIDEEEQIENRGAAKADALVVVVPPAGGAGKFVEPVFLFSFSYILLLSTNHYRCCDTTSGYQQFT